MISFNPHSNFIFHWGGWYSKWFCTACIRCNWVRAPVFCLKSGFFRCKDMLWLFLAQFFILAYKQAPQRYWSTFLYQCKILNLTHFLSDKKQKYKYSLSANKNSSLSWLDSSSCLTFLKYPRSLLEVPWGLIPKTLWFVLAERLHSLCFIFSHKIINLYLYRSGCC